MEIASDLFTEAEASEYLGDVPTPTLKRWRYEGRGPKYVRLRRLIRYRRRDLDAWVEDNLVDPLGAA